MRLWVKPKTSFYRINPFAPTSQLFDNTVKDALKKAILNHAVFLKFIFSKTFGYLIRN